MSKIYCIVRDSFSKIINLNNLNEIVFHNEDYEIKFCSSKVSRIYGAKSI